MIKFLYILTLSSFCFFGSFISRTKVKHSIKVIHKGISETNPVACTLIEIQDKEGKPEEFYMDVESVVCGDNQCRIDMVRIYWDKLGRYNRFELPDGIDLEKAAGENFSSSDYEKLDAILKNENSSLQDVYKNEIVGTIGSEGADAMSGATILIEKSSYVEGAVWTCYSLWHWVHGETKQIIRDITGDSYSISTLQNLLQQKNYQKFAIQQLTKRNDFSEKTVDLILKVVEKNLELLKTSLNYWEIAPNSVYQNSMRYLIFSGNTASRLLCFNAVLHAKQDLTSFFFQNFKTIVPKLTYQEVHVLLKILKAKNKIPKGSISSFIKQLENDDFFIARRFFFFLKEQKLTPSQEQLMEVFYQKWKDRL